jgi:hypothetical protein
MTLSPKKSQGEFAKIMTAACVRRGYLEKLHAGITPVTRTGDYSDLKVIDAKGREIPWNQVSRINQNEMKMLIIPLEKCAVLLRRHGEIFFGSALKKSSVGKNYLGRP